MNTEAVLHYGHQTVLEAIRPIPAWAWAQPGVCGVWSLQDVIAHLASFEHVLGEVLASFLSQTATPLLDEFLADHEQFNRHEVARRHDLPHETVLAEYCQSYDHAARLLRRIPVEMRQQCGTLPWYGDDYDLDDFLVYTFYGHKREHAAQIAILAEQVARNHQGVATQDNERRG